jgi:hypothetical protein
MNEIMVTVLKKRLFITVIICLFNFIVRVKPINQLVHETTTTNTTDYIINTKFHLSQKVTYNENLSSNVHKIAQKRDLRNKAYIKLQVVCDFYCFKRHEILLDTKNEEIVSKHIQAYYAMVISLANINYKHSFENDTELELEMFVISYTILTNENSSRFTTNEDFSMKVNGQLNDDQQRKYVNFDLALSDLNQWLIYQIGDENKFDISIIFTYANIYTKKNDILGLSVIGGACRSGTNGIIIEDNGAFSSSKTLAHEVAHSLGIILFCVGLFFTGLLILNRRPT